MIRTVCMTLALALPVAAQRDRSRSQGSGEEIWKVLAERYDKNRDDRITEKEYPRSRSKFVAYDANADGVLTREDFEGAGRMDFGRTMLGRPLRAADTDQDGAVDAREWQAFLASLGADREGVVPADKLEDAEPSRGDRRGRSASLDRDGDGRIELSDLALVHALIDVDEDGVLSADELSGRPSKDGAPEAGQPAPDFELALAEDPERKVRLSSFKGERPVALVFGSYT